MTHARSLFYVAIGLAISTRGHALAESLAYRHQEIEHTVMLYAPATAHHDPRPLVVALHGLHQSVDSLRRWLPLDRVAEREGFVVAYPVAIDLR